MFAGFPFYRNSPYIHSSYHQPQYDQHFINGDRARAKRAQWLPDEEDDYDDYESHQLGPRERAYLTQEEQRWQQELDRRERDDQEARKKAEEEREKRRQNRSHEVTDPESICDSAVNHPGQPRGSPPLPSSNDPRPSSPKQKPFVIPQYDERHVEATMKLQHYFRVHQCQRAIKGISSQFNALRKEFTPPSTISFQKSSSPSDVVTIPAILPSDLSPKDSVDTNSDSDIPKLAYNSTNYNLHAYLESLDKLLVKLDGVESWGDSYVREKRRAVVKQIEGEQNRVDRICKASWLKHVEH
ncbi:hypothetical protein P691DRAFT_663418 [Macrolepiota fuliginosa MF-IS2]|uniref:BAG domain-containing protein n=1 Tax=Macrolepiota fuliginosa MF-IS2 TaxID=1400762 RepID=A0A9P6C7J0_9AGAR|nr:hypothetical protein P691DRAFT_663418 [Macrolepiota fuliginosa MF-IS2]